MQEFKFIHVSEARIMYVISEKVYDFVSKVAILFLTFDELNKIRFEANDMFPFPERFMNVDSESTVVRCRMDRAVSQIEKELVTKMTEQQLKDFIASRIDVSQRTETVTRTRAKAFNKALDALIALPGL